MISVLFISPEKDHLSELASTIAAGHDIFWETTGTRALEWLREQSVDLVVADEDLGDMNGLELVERLVALNPMINCALVSGRDAAGFHEASEGLGILMQLPPHPRRSDGKRLMSHLRQVLGQTTAAE